jgi:hypothetical protein
MGQIIEINQRLTQKLLDSLQGDVRVKSISYGGFGAEIELKDEFPEASTDAFITDFNKQLVRKKPPQGPPQELPQGPPQGPPQQPPPPQEPT